jgi:hypothetical protein
MKHTLLLALCAVSNLHAADAVVVVSATSVTVNGVNAGKAADTIRNRPELASAIQRALEVREAEQAATLDSIRSQLAVAKAANASLVARLQAAGTNPVELVKVWQEAVTPELEKRRAALSAELAAKKKELESLK